MLPDRHGRMPWCILVCMINSYDTGAWNYTVRQAFTTVSCFQCQSESMPVASVAYCY